ncbi:MAG: hypothetical protein JST59_29350 [Actinobacteria bacterium]|nr:hypothetical protein [Actinomycetota bacterium]
MHDPEAPTTRIVDGSADKRASTSVAASHSGSTRRHRPPSASTATTAIVVR